MLLLFVVAVALKMSSSATTVASLGIGDQSADDEKDTKSSNGVKNVNKPGNKGDKTELLLKV